MGAIVSGTLADTYSDNATRLVLSEVAGPGPTFNYDFLFYNVPPARYYVKLDGYYAGNPSHLVKLQILNHQTSSWENLTAAADDMPSAGSDQSYSWQLPAAFGVYFSNGEFDLKFLHTSSGNTGHQLLLDYLRLDASP